MGWAKYYEDNMSIYIGRMGNKDFIPLHCVKPCDVRHETEEPPFAVKPNYDIVSRPKNQNGRRGLELTFTQNPEKNITIKLRLNGWWWSSNNCWCNLDTVGNRKYAQHMISLTEAHLSLINS